MKNINIELHLGDGQCIECAAKHEYNRQAIRIMASEDQPTQNDELKLELLLEFLDNADFAALRSSSESLSGFKKCRCLLQRNNEGKPSVAIID